MIKLHIRDVELDSPGFGTSSPNTAFPVYEFSMRKHRSTSACRPDFDSELQLIKEPINAGSTMQTDLQCSVNQWHTKLHRHKDFVNYMRHTVSAITVCR